MRNFRKLIHSPHHLFVFEVSARRLSFTHAAKELGVSQPAVSLAIRQLESSMGQKLFQRYHRQISLTDIGQQFYKDVSRGLGLIMQSAESLSQIKTPAQVTLSVSTAFANYWVMPRMMDLHSAYPGIDLRLQVVDKDLDLENDNVSLGIRRGNKQLKGYQRECIAKEELLAVASASYVDKNGLPASLMDLSEHHLIHLEEPYRPRPTWKDWFEYFDFRFIDQGNGMRLNDYALVVQAAMSGEGIAIGWRHIVNPLIQRGLLEEVFPKTWATGEDFYLIWSEKNQISEPAQQVRQWIIEQSKLEN